MEVDLPSLKVNASCRLPVCERPLDRREQLPPGPAYWAEVLGDQKGPAVGASPFLLCMACSPAARAFHWGSILASAPLAGAWADGLLGFACGSMVYAPCGPPLQGRIILSHPSQEASV